MIDGHMDRGDGARELYLLYHDAVIWLLVSFIEYSKNECERQIGISTSSNSFESEYKNDESDLLNREVIIINSHTHIHANLHTYSYISEHVNTLIHAHAHTHTHTHSHSHTVSPNSKNAKAHLFEPTISSTTLLFEISLERNCSGSDRFLPSLLPRWL